MLVPLCPHTSLKSFPRDQGLARSLVLNKDSINSCLAVCVCLAKQSLLSLRFKQSGGRTTVYASSHRTNFVVNATEEIALHTEHAFQTLKDREALRYGCQSVTGNETPQHTGTKPPKSPFCTCLQLPHSPCPPPRA